MKASEVRQSFLEFFADKGHRIVPSSPVIPHGDPTLLFTNAGMNQFKDVFLGQGTREYVRAADTQKCIRAGGKHNDLEDVGRDTYHHTFFEMLGNWSFGDYYKPEAIAWAWELLTGVWGLEKQRLYATVYETDDEAATLWPKVTDIHPSRVLRFGRKDNFWEMGETGPCGPCSEIHIDLTPDLSGGSLVNAGDPRVMEIWNLVFIQNNRNERGELEPLPAKHVDTGMGFERVTAVLQGKSSNYDTDIFVPIMEAISGITGKPYEGEANQVAMRVIADHIRMLTFAIADGALPGSDKRGYILRRVLRRAARFGRTLGMREPFLHRVPEAVIAIMGHAFPEITEKRGHVERVIRTEEESFDLTLDRGIELFESVAERIGHSTVFPGEDAFRLHDTYGFPIDLTQLMAEERGLKVDVARYRQLMEEQQDRARTAARAETPAGLPELLVSPASAERSMFVGYDAMEVEAVVLEVMEDRFVVLDRTPFYVASGGQIDDVGVLEGDGFLAEVLRSMKRDQRVIHEVRVSRGSLAAMRGRRVAARVDAARRLDIQRNHSATHLVHEALRRVLGTHVHQQGSLVAPDRLRFDFPHFGKVTLPEIRAIEEMVNAKIGEAVPVRTDADLPIEKARVIPNVKMFFGDKYGDTVRVVTMDDRYSVEFCGGTHVRSTAEIGLFKIVSEVGIASGVRRIEAVTGAGVRAYIDGQAGKVREADGRLAELLEEIRALERLLPTDAPLRPPALPPALTLPSDERSALGLVGTALAEREQAIEEATRIAHDLKKTVSRSKVVSAGSDIDALLLSAVTAGGVRVAAGRVDATSMDELKALGDALRLKLGSGVGVLGSVIDGKAALVCVVTDDLLKRGPLQAGKLVGELARRVGGGGGGRPHLATAGGKDAAKLDQTLQEVPAVVAAMGGTH
jgi:alanyl-tRNA synthetase